MCTHANPHLPPDPVSLRDFSTTGSEPFFLESSVDLPEGEANDHQSQDGMSVILRRSIRAVGRLEEVDNTSQRTLHDIEAEQHNAPCLFTSVYQQSVEAG